MSLCSAWSCYLCSIYDKPCWGLTQLKLPLYPQGPDARGLLGDEGGPVREAGPDPVLQPGQGKEGRITVVLRAYLFLINVIMLYAKAQVENVIIS